MSEESPNASIRLRESGVGVVIGGLGISWLSFVLSPYEGAFVVLGIAVLWAVITPPIGNAKLVSLGIGLVGAIALLEASPFGIGFDPLLIGVFAIAFGMVDVVLGLTTHRMRQRSHASKK